MKLSKLKHKLLLTCILFSFLGYSQSHFLEFATGYALGTANQSIGIRSVFSPGDSVQKELKGTLGQGHSYGLRYGYHFKNNLLLDCAVSRFVGFRYDFQNQFIPEDLSSADTTTIIYMIEGKAIRFIPSIGYHMEHPKNSFYFKAGMILALPSVRFRERGAYGDGTKIFIETIYNKGFALGTSVEIGMEHHFNSHLSFLANLQLISMSYAPKKGVIVNYLYNGVDVTDNLSTYERVVEYHNETTIQGVFDSNSPRQEIRHYQPFSSIGLHFGIRYRLGK